MRRQAQRSTSVAIEPTSLRVRLLGDFDLTHGDQPVSGIDTPRLRSLLAYLLMHRGAPQLRQQLAFLFWPDSSEPQARNNLRQMLHELRHRLPDFERFVHADARTVGWRCDAPFELDVAELERALAAAGAAGREDIERAALERAARLYRGDLLAGSSADWIAAEREPLRQRHRRALARLVALLEAQREYGEATRHAQRLLRDDPLDEEACRLVMRVQALNGDRAGALRAYQSCAASLRAELGVEPTAATRALHERLLRPESLAEPAPRRWTRAPASIRRPPACRSR